MIIKKIHIVIICCICSISCFSAESITGILFTSSTERVNDRTSLVIFDDKLQKFEDSFSISFELSIWDIKQFGYVLRVIDGNKKEVDFVFVNFYGEDKMYLDFHSPITHKSVQIPITKEEINNKKWLDIDINFNLKEDKATIWSKDSLFTCEPIGLENPSFLRFAFGLYSINLDVPRMSIRNIRIHSEITGKNKNFYFPLSESQGEEVHDETGKVRGYVRNPEWIINRHFYWQSEGVFIKNDDVGIGYDKLNNRISIINKDSALLYYPRNKHTESYPLRGIKDDIKINKVICNEETREYFVYNATSELTKSLISIISLDNFTVKHSGQSEMNVPLHHSAFFSEDGVLNIFGGYGNHSYSNKISSYNPKEANWTTTNYSGDDIMPRFYSAIGDGFNPWEKLLFGGFGNETGKQEHGGGNLYDLYLLDMRANSIKKLWDFENNSENIFIPSSNLILNKEKTHFYTLCYPHHNPRTTMYLYRFNLQNGTYDIVSDSISFVSEELNTSVYLFHNELMNEFYAVVKEFPENSNTNIRIYSLLSPPILKKQLSDNAKTAFPKSILLIIILLTILSSTFFTLKFFLITRRKKQKNKEELEMSEENFYSEQAQRKKNSKSAIYTYGDFTVFDNKGADISYRFSSKLKYLFALILLHTDKNSGISTEKMTSDLWPEKDSLEAKNIRGVTINRLRNILSDIDGITLTYQNSQWYFVYEDSFYCDYLERLSISDQVKILSEEMVEYELLMDKLVAILSEGPLFQNLQDTWIDFFKTKEEEAIEKIMLKYISFLYKNKKYNKLIFNSKVFLKIEPLNEEVLELCMKSFYKLGKKEQAHQFLSKFKETYKTLMGEEYKHKSF